MGWFVEDKCTEYALLKTKDLLAQSLNRCTAEPYLSESNTGLQKMKQGLHLQLGEMNIQLPSSYEKDLAQIVCNDRFLQFIPPPPHTHGKISKLF